MVVSRLINRALFVTLAFFGNAAFSQAKISIGNFNVQNYILGTYVNTEFISTPQQMDVKVHALANAIALLNLDILTFAEMSSQENLDRLLDHPELKDLGYQTHFMSGKPDGRGIDLGIISKFPAVSPPQAHIYWDDSDPLWNVQGTLKAGGRATRPIMEIQLRLPNGRILNVLVNHGPSKLEGEWGVVRRAKAAEFMKMRADAIQKADPGALLLVIGDMNTEPWSAVTKGVLGARNVPGTSADSESNFLYNLDTTIGDYEAQVRQFKKDHPKATEAELTAFTNGLDATHGTYYWPQGQKWDTLDQMIVNGNMLRLFVPGSFGTVRSAPFINDQGHPNIFCSELLTGVSDHFPIRAQFRLDVGY